MYEIDLILSAEKECVSQTNTVLNELIEYDYELFINYLKISEKYSKKRPKRNIERPVAILFINDRIFKTLYCVLDLLKKGHYNESASLQRGVLELVTLAEYFLKNPQDSQLWIDGKTIKFAKANKGNSSPQFDREIYDYLCDFTHPNSRSTIRESGVIHPELGRSFSFKPFFQCELARDLLTHHITLTHRAMKAFLKFIEDFHTDVDAEDSENVNAINEKLVEVFKFLQEEI